MSNPHFRINHQIQAKEVRLLRADGSQIGVVSRDVALSQAKTDGVDAVEIAPMAVPPVVKLIDYKKLLYQMAKKEQAARASAKKVDLKEVRLTPFMAENDFATRIGLGRVFRLKGNKKKIATKFVGWENGKKTFGDIVMNRAFAALEDVSTVDQPAKWFGKQYIATLTPVKKSQPKAEKQNEQQTENSQISS